MSINIIIVFSLLNIFLNKTTLLILAVCLGFSNILWKWYRINCDYDFRFVCWKTRQLALIVCSEAHLLSLSLPLSVWHDGHGAAPHRLVHQVNPHTLKLTEKHNWNGKNKKTHTAQPRRHKILSNVLFC